ncbi:hypothetical protein [Sphingomonas koreensis]
MVVWNEATLQTKERVQAADAAHDYAASADKEIGERCLRLETERQVYCIKKTVEASRESQREESDLVAQRQAARWTMVAGGAASAGFLISILGIGLVFLTFKESRRAADAAIHAIDMQIESERPIVQLMGAWVTDFERGKDGSAKMKFGYEFHNLGQTVAWIECVEISLHADPLYKELDLHAVTCFAAPGKGISIKDNPLEMTATAEEMQIFDESQAFFLRGVSEYRNAAGVRWRTGFLFHLRFVAGGFSSPSPLPDDDTWSDQKLSRKSGRGYKLSRRARAIDEKNDERYQT